LVLLVGLYIALVAGIGLIALLVVHTVTLKAYAYGLLLDTRFLVFFLVTWLVSRHNRLILDHWRQLLLIPASAVVLFALLQFTVLPADFLRHFGYGPGTIDAVQTVDQKAGYQRVQSTLRGANPLGAYLIVVLTTLGGITLRSRTRAPRRWSYAALFAFVASSAALAATFSRSAWIGAVAALGWLLWQGLRFGRTRRGLLIAGCAAVLAVGVITAVGFTLRNNDVFQNTILHTDEHSRSAASSNQGHLAATRAGVRDILHQPLGGGTGTAGPASVYNTYTDNPFNNPANNHSARIAENYFVQIGQEAGIAGLGLFVVINVLVARNLWQRRAGLLPQVLLASLIGISLVNLLSHAWTDDTLSYIWWGMAGAAMALPPMPAQRTLSRLSLAATGSTQHEA
jgi:hypothetical protein